jgi:hypothetical protein
LVESALADDANGALLLRNFMDADPDLSQRPFADARPQLVMVFKPAIVVLDSTDVDPLHLFVDVVVWVLFLLGFLG